MLFTIMSPETALHGTTQDGSYSAFTMNFNHLDIGVFVAVHCPH
jgi:hypothetical protein